MYSYYQCSKPEKFSGSLKGLGLVTATVVFRITNPAGVQLSGRVFDCTIANPICLELRPRGFQMFASLSCHKNLREQFNRDLTKQNYIFQ